MKSNNTAPVSRYFGYKREKGQNPYSGFMSFQHFRGEKLYSDIVVRPENNRTETERVECYPPSPDAEENGREEGYYPDTSVAYIRILWREFEPKRGEYNYAFIDSIINEARAHDQSIIFRLMAHSTRASDDVPDWLRDLIDCPERPDGMRIKDSPSDPLFIDLFLRAVEAFALRYDEEPLLDAVDISLPGAWGEGYKLEQYPPDTFDRILKTYIRVFKNTTLLGQAAKPELVLYPTDGAPIGWRGDGFGSPEHIFVHYPKYIVPISDVWKRAPVSFESYWWIGEWQRQGWDIDKIIELSLEWHLSSFNAKSMPIPFEWKDKIDGWVAKMGYHFSPYCFTCPKNARAGEELRMTLELDNLGVAPIYKPVALRLRLIPSVSNASPIDFTTDIDVREFMPGRSIRNIGIRIPTDAPVGKYSVAVSIGGGDYPVIYLATDAPETEGYYILGELEVCP